MSDIAVRILHTHYDHLSLLARMGHLKIHTSSQRSDVNENTSITTISLTLIIMLVIRTFFSLLCVLVFPHLFGPRSLAGGDEVPADIDLPEQGETKEDGDVKDDSETQQQRVDEEVQSIQGLEGRKVKQMKK